jgi:hypothetical protein
MDEQLPSASAHETKTTSSAWWADLRCLAILAVLVVGLRTWQIAHTEVVSRDSISYIRMAWQLEHGSWGEVFRLSPQHPAYSLTVLAMSVPVRHYLPDDLPRAWQLSAQLASALASVLLVVPMFYLGRELFNRRVAFWACLLFQCLPSSGKVMGDGLSDTVFLLFACAGLWLACLALRRGSWIAFALTGLFGGLAYLTRPEGALIVGATGLVILGLQLSRHWRRSWRSVLINGSALSVAGLATMTPYMAVIGGLTIKNTPNILINKQRDDSDWEKRLRPEEPAKEAEPHSGLTAGSTMFAIWWHPTEAELRAGKSKPRTLWALKALATETSKAFFYAAWAPALLGLWWFRHRFRRIPGTWVLMLVCLILVGLLYRVAEKMGYLSDRHLLLVVLCGSYWAVAAVGLLGERLAAGAARLRPALAGRRWTVGRVWSLGLLSILILAPLPRTLATLHGERKGFRTVGHWLAENICPGDYIEDPYGWASYYAGRVFLEGCPDLPAQEPPCYYIVLEEAMNKHPHLVSLGMALVHLMLNEKTLIHEQVVKRGKEKVKIMVFKVKGRYRWMPFPALPGQRG